jgi:hypothetical protein
MLMKDVRERGREVLYVREKTENFLGKEGSSEMGYALIGW